MTIQWFRQSTAVSCIVGPVLDSSGAEYASAVIGDLSLSKNGATLTALASAATLTYIANGYYTLALTTGNTDTLGRADISCNKSTYQMPPRELMVLPATVYDAFTANATAAVGGLGDIQRMAGTALTARDIGASVLLSTGTGTGQLNFTSGVVQADAAKINGVATTSVTAVSANVGTTQPLNFTGTAGIALVKSDMQDIAGSVVNANTVQIGVNVIQAAGTSWNSGAISRSALSADSGLQSSRSSTATAGGSTSITLDASASSTNDFYKGQRIYLTGSTGAGQDRVCTGYNGTTKVATVAPAWATNPANGTTFAVLPDASADVEAVLGAATVGAAGYMGVDWSAINAPTTTVVLSGTTVGAATAVTGQLTAAQIATGVWTDLLSGSDFSTSSSIGKLLKDDIDAAVSSRAAASTALSTATWSGTLATNLATLAGHDPGTTIGTSTYAGADTSGTTTLLARLTSTRAGLLDNLDAAVSSRLAPTVAARTLDVSATGTAGIDWANVDNQTAAVSLVSTVISGLTDGVGNVTVGAVVDGAITDTSFDPSFYAALPTAADVAAVKAKTDNLPAAPASTTNIAAGTITTVTNLTNAPTAGDLTGTMKASVTAAVPTAAANAAATLAGGDVDGFSLEQTLKLCLAALAGKLGGNGTVTVTIRAADDSKARITATIDGSSNRTAITLDATG